jgi:hypothetical protein
MSLVPATLEIDIEFGGCFVFDAACCFGFYWVTSCILLVRFQLGASHQSGADEVLKRSDFRSISVPCVSPIKPLKPIIGFIAGESAVTASHQPIGVHVPFQQVSRDQFYVYQILPQRHCVIPLPKDQGVDWQRKERVGM